MESSQITGDAEECRSCESGWTMYIGSSIDVGDDDHSEQDDEEDGVGDHSDDSMVSDASSGPSHRLGNGEGGYCRIVEVKHDDQELYGSKHGSYKKSNKPKQRRERSARIITEKEKMFKEKKSKASFQVSLGNQKR